MRMAGATGLPLRRLQDFTLDGQSQMASPTVTRLDVGGREIRDSVVIRFAGDSGDGMQLAGSQFMQETALAGSDLATFPDYPAEIRAPA